MGLPAQNADGYKQGSAINFAEGLKGGLLIVHGSGDDNVHYQGSELLVNRLIELGKPFDFMTYPDRTHSISEGAGHDGARVSPADTLSDRAPAGGSAVVHQGPETRYVIDLPAPRRWCRVWTFMSSEHLDTCRGSARSARTRIHRRVSSGSRPSFEGRTRTAQRASRCTDEGGVGLRLWPVVGSRDARSPGEDLHDASEPLGSRPAHKPR